jgi:hypothetical protein
MAALAYAMERTQQRTQGAVAALILRQQRAPPTAMHEFATEHRVQANASRSLGKRV